MANEVCSSLSDLCKKYPCRKNQINSLHKLLGSDYEPLPEALFIYGQPAVGKTEIVRDYLNTIGVNYAFINCVECYTHRLLHERIASEFYTGIPLKCDNFMDLIHYIKLLPVFKSHSKRFIIVLDGIEYLQDLGEHYLKGFSNIQELIPSEDTSVIFISRILPEKFNLDGSLITLHFPQYSKDDLLEILKLCKPEICSEELYENFLNSALSTFLRTTRDLNEMKFLVSSNFEAYYEPISKGNCKPDNVSALWRNILPHFKSSLDSVYSGLNTQNIERFQYDPQKNEVICSKGPSVLDLPYYAKYFLIAAYLASYNLPKHDKRLFLKNHGKKKKHTFKSTKEKVTLELLGPKSFPLDRLLAIFYAIMDEKASLTVNLITQITTLVELKLLARIGDFSLDRPKFKCLVGFQSIEQVARTLGFNIKKYMLN